MNSQSHPILIELSQQLPETSKTCKYIRGTESFSQVVTQAQEEFSCLCDLDADRGNGFTGSTQLAENGYESYLKDMEDFGAVNEAYGSFFAEAPPARACIEAARLPKDAVIMVDCIAVGSKPESQ